MQDMQHGVPSQRHKEAFVDEMVKQLLTDQLRELQEEARQLMDRNAPESLAAQPARQGGIVDSRSAGR